MAQKKFPYQLADAHNENVEDITLFDSVYAIGQLETDLGFDILGIVGTDFKSYKDIPQYEGVYEVNVVGAQEGKKCLMYIWKAEGLGYRHRGYVVYADDTDKKLNFLEIAEKAYAEKRAHL